MLATGSHPALRESAAQVRALGGKWVQVGLRPNPTIGYAGNEIGDEGTAGQQGGFVGQEFVTAGKLDLNRSIVMREQQAAEQRLQRTQLQVITTVRKYYFEALAAERSVDAGPSAERHCRAVGSRFGATARRRLIFPRPRCCRARLKANRRRCWNSRRTSGTRRRGVGWHRSWGCRAIGRWHSRMCWRGRLPELDFATVSERIKRESPELAELRFDVEQARAAVERASAGRVPNMTVQAGVQYDNATQDNIANVQVSIPLPVFRSESGRHCAGLWPAIGGSGSARGARAGARSATVDFACATIERLASG